MSKKKILHLMTSLNAGGAETNLLALLRHYDKEVYEHAIAFGGSDGALANEFASLGIGLIKISPKPFCVQSLLNSGKIISKISKYSPDIIHSHLDLTNVLGLWAKKKLGCKLVLHFHGLGMIPHKLLPNRPFKHQMWNLIAKAYKYCDKAIAICHFQLPFLKGLGFKQEQIVMIPNGISMDTPIPETTGSFSGYQFVNIGRFQPQKDHQMLINAFQIVVQKAPESKLVLVGDGPLKNSIEAQVRSLGLEKHVGFLGVRRDIPDILAASDCFVLGSRWELHPITILEAMRAELPVIASNVGGIADTVDDGKTGILTEAENTESLANAMIELATNQEQGKAMGKRGKKRVQHLFNNEKVAKQIEQVYRDILAG